MPIDTSMYQNMLRPPKSVAEYDAEAMQGQTNKLALMTGQQKADEYQRSVADNNRLRGVVSGFGSDQTANYNALLGAGRLDEAQKYQKGNADLGKINADAAETKSKTKKTDLDSASHQFEIAGQLASAWATRTDVTKAQVQAGLAAALHSGVISPEIAQAKMAELTAVSEDPKAINVWANGTLQQVMKAKDSMSYIAPDANAKLTAQTSTDNSIRTAASSKYSADSSAGSAAAGRAQADRHFNATPKGQITQTDAGTMLVDPRTGQATPVTLAGQPLGAKLKEIPASVNTAIIANSQSLSQLDKTIALLEGKSISGQVGDSAATGIKGYLPQQMLNAIDPQGIDARAGVADIGSLKLHDRSGAAVTASESPRLMPFIPVATDSNATALKKLKRLKQEVESESAAMGDTYSKEQGYRPNPVLTRNAAPPAGKPSLSDIFGK